MQFLEKMHVNVTKKEITETPPTLDELKAMLSYQGGHLKKLFNTSGNLYRELHLNEKFDSLTLSDALKMLSQHGMLIKRPFLLGEGFGLLGFKENEWVERLNASQQH